MDSPIHTEEYKGYIISIYPDSDSDSPRSWENVGTLVCFHPDYIIGDKHNFSDADDVMNYIKDTKSVWLPVYMYEHSGVALSTKPFSDPWDSGQVGVIFVTREKMKKDKLTKKQVLKNLEAEIETLNQYVNGDVYGFTIQKENICNKCKHDEPEMIENVWGFYGQNTAIEEARSMIDYYLKK